MKNPLTFFSSRSTTCRRTATLLSAYVDEALPHAERREVAVHVRECASCESRYRELAATRKLVKRLPLRTPPPELNAKLRQLAAQASAARREELLGQGAVRFAWQSVRLRMQNVMQPLAIPFAGGLVSALVLFSMLVPTYPAAAAKNTSPDVPSAFYQGPSLKSIAPFASYGDEFVVEVTIDEQGQVIDYTLPEGKVSAETKREIENTLLFVRFNPATFFFQPTSGKIRLSFSRSRIDVKG